MVGLRDDGSEESEKAALALAERLANHGAPDAPWVGTPTWWQETLDALAADGLEYDADGARLVASVPGVSMPVETSLLEEALVAAGRETAAGHYRQALDSFAAGNWAASNSQIRSFLEDFIPNVAQNVTRRGSRTPLAALQALQRSGDLVDGEFDFGRGLWAMCQSAGPHPGLSDQEEARFRLIAATGYARYVVSRLDE